MFREATSKLKPLYTTVYSCAYSTCGSYLAASNNYGEIAIFNLTPLIEYNENSQLEASQKYPIFKFSAHVGPIYSLISTGQFLISGSIGEIKIWKWSDLRKKEAKVEFTFVIPQGDSLCTPEVNSLVFSKKENDALLFAGCGNNNVYCFDFEKRTTLFTLEGHTNYIHCVDLFQNGNECVTGSEDGTVRIWDTRKGGNAVHVLEPFNNKLTARSKIGKWVKCVALDPSDDWLVCGGAPHLSAWHLRSLTPATILQKECEVTSNVAQFHKDMIISGGSEAFVNHWSLDGNLEIEVPTSAAEVFCININSNPSHKVLVASGSSYKIDLCTDFRYKDFSVNFCDM